MKRSDCEIKDLPLKRCEIQISVDLVLAPGDSVTRMGTHGWRGEVLQVDSNSVLVRWNGNRKQWVDRYEVYPLDEFGQPRKVEMEKDLLEIVRRSRHLLETKMFNEPTLETEQLRFF